ncbi:chemotaxis protein MotC [Rhizobium sp. HT1-10]|uniref:chemotaxis protein MotC n=1 Tax=Rhizobium sp. HT1-10 TaxID=3111638 RepID=UPI003C21E554
MTRGTLRYTLALSVALGALAPGCGYADDKDLAPYKMLRSLQFVQDSVVLGDHSAGEMQRFMLSTIDERFRSADKSVFEDARNVDAALIYTMSGGNPATLEFLMSKDVDGNFDNRVADVLRKHLSGKGLLVVKTMANTAKEYRDKKIGPYLSLVAANVMSAKDPKAALKLYDWARLTSPGTIVEEAALRRSMSLATEAKMVPASLFYSQIYARRFLHSPYASQFADLFVQLVVDHNTEIKPEDIVDTLGFMDGPRQREVYLRIARSATIAGKNDLARMASTQAAAVPSDGSDSFGQLATFYKGVSNVSTDKANDALRDISQIPDGELNQKDRALRDAARAVADEVTRLPDAQSLTQVSTDTPVNEEVQHDGAAGVETPGTTPAAAVVEQGATAQAASTRKGEGQDADSSFNTFVKTNQSKLDALDGLLKQ